MNRRRVFIYGFNGLHKLEECAFLNENEVSVRNMAGIAEWMMANNKSVRVVYAVDNRYGLYREYAEAKKTQDFTKHLEFEDTVSHEGLKIMSR